MNVLPAIPLLTNHSVMSEAIVIALIGAGATVAAAAIGAIIAGIFLLVGVIIPLMLNTPSGKRVILHWLEKLGGYKEPPQADE